MNDSKLDDIRRNALNQIDKSRHRAKACLIAAGIAEALLLVAVILMIDPSSRTHKLIFLCSCLVYCPLVLGLLALRSYIDFTGQRILAAVDRVIRDESDSEAAAGR